MSVSPAVWVIATTLPDKTLLLILDLPPLTLIPAFVTLLLAITALAFVIVMKLPLKLLPSSAMLPVLKVMFVSAMLDSVTVKVDSSSVERTVESSKAMFLMVAFAPLVTWMTGEDPVPVNLLPLKFKVKSLSIMIFSDKSLVISITSPSSALSIASCMDLYMILPIVGKSSKTKVYEYSSV